MLFRSMLYIAGSAVLLTTVLSSTSSAQWRGFRQPAQKVCRLLGHGYSAGYHWENPGHDSSYYNPYSTHNSMLMSQLGSQSQFDVMSNDSYQQPGVPYSVYAPQPLGEVYQEAPSHNEVRPNPPFSNESENGGAPDESGNPGAEGDSAIYQQLSPSEMTPPEPRSNDFVPIGFSNRGNTSARSQLDPSNISVADPSTW